MAKVSLENLPEESLQNTGNGNGPQVSFFSLKDGEEATVRILISNYNDFDIHTVHNVKMEGYQYGRRMNCLRQPTDPLEVCPLCAAGHNLDQKLYLHMIQYTIEGDKIVAKAKVWERSIKDRNFGVTALKTHLNNYGDLSEMVCKIVRRGSGLNTEYQLLPNLNPAVYRPDLYVKDTTPFDNWDPIGIAILNKTAAEYTTFLATGAFPQTQNNNVTTNTQVTPRTYDNSVNATIPSTTQYQAPATPSAAPNTFVPDITTAAPATPTYEAPAQPAYQPPVNPTPSIPNQPVGETPYGNTSAPANMPWNNTGATGGFERPRRY